MNLTGQLQTQSCGPDMVAERGEEFIRGGEKSVGIHGVCLGDWFGALCGTCGSGVQASISLQLILDICTRSFWAAGNTVAD